METVEKQLDWLLRVNQMDLANLDRERLEQIVQGLLEGQIRVFESLALETRQSEIIRGLNQALRRQTEQLHAATDMSAELSQILTALEDPNDTAYRDIFLVLADYIVRTWTSPPDIVPILTGIWRGVELAIAKGDIDPISPVGEWWADMSHRNYGLPQEVESDGTDEVDDD